MKGTPPAHPYHGPLDVPTKELDGSGPRALPLASGAPGRALECDGEIHDGSGPDGWAASEGGGAPGGAEAWPRLKQGVGCKCAVTRPRTPAPRPHR
ncbi:hypothetical protein ACWDZ8_28445 [Streptomyces sp. NPDC003233]